MHCLEGTSNVADRPSQQNSSYIIDGNALIQAQAGIPVAFGELAGAIFDQLPKTERVDFVTDRYIPVPPKRMKDFYEEHPKLFWSKAHTDKNTT